MGGGAAGGVPGAAGGPSGGSHETPDKWTPGGSARLADEKGNPVDGETARLAEDGQEGRCRRSAKALRRARLPHERPGLRLAIAIERVAEALLVGEQMFGTK